MPRVDVCPDTSIDPSGKDVIVLQNRVYGRFMQISVESEIEDIVFGFELNGCPGGFVMDG